MSFNDDYPLRGCFGNWAHITSPTKQQLHQPYHLQDASDQPPVTPPHHSIMIADDRYVRLAAIKSLRLRAATDKAPTLWVCLRNGAQIRSELPLAAIIPQFHSLGHRLDEQGELLHVVPNHHSLDVVSITTPSS